MSELDELKQNVRGGHCVAIVGTGASVAMSGGHATADWAGLLLAGIKRLQEQGEFNADDANRLSLAIRDGGSSEDLLNAASEIERAFDAVHAGEFERWMRHDVGNIPLKDSRLAESIKALQIPILTTNYDDLLEKATGLDRETWLNSANFQQIAIGRAEGVGHIHGIWSNKDSIVLSRRQYSKMMEDRSLEAIRQSLFGQKSILFIGFGEGLNDPNFEQLKTWVDITSPKTEIRHYRLCRLSEVGALRDKLRGTPIIPIPYGKEYDDLPAFLQSLQTQREEKGGCPGPAAR